MQTQNRTVQNDEVGRGCEPARGQRYVLNAECIRQVAYAAHGQMRHACTHRRATQKSAPTGLSSISLVTCDSSAKFLTRPQLSPSGVSAGHSIPHCDACSARGPLTYARELRRSAKTIMVRARLYLACLLELRRDACHHAQAADVRQTRQHLRHTGAVHTKTLGTPVARADGVRKTCNAQHSVTAATNDKESAHTHIRTQRQTQRDRVERRTVSDCLGAEAFCDIELRSAVRLRQKPIDFLL